MATWRLAISLATLRNEINVYAPNRSKRSDGTIGDPAHQQRCSRHNPNQFGVVTALDITNDPANNMPVHDLARLLTVKPRHSELEYIVSNRQIAGKSTNWQWRTYFGSNPHTLHAHFAVGLGTDCNSQPPYDSQQSWNVAKLLSPPVEESDDLMDPVYFRNSLGHVKVYDPYARQVSGVTYNEYYYVLGKDLEDARLIPDDRWENPFG